MALRATSALLTFIAVAPAAAVGGALRLLHLREHMAPFPGPVAEVHTEGVAGPRQEAELLRFVTAYRTGMEAVVDVTPYAPLLQAAAADGGPQGNLTFYAFIDTWVNNGTGRDVLYLDNETGLCSKLHKSDGNGWTLSLDLLVWPRGQDVRPRESQMLASGYFGGNYPFGKISFVEGRVGEEGSILLETEGLEAQQGQGNAPVYRCDNGAHDLEMPSLLGYAAEQASFLAERYGPESKEFRDLSDELLETLLYPKLHAVDVTAVDNESNVVSAKFDPSAIQPHLGMPVFYESTDVYTDAQLSTMWLNMTYPFNKTGKVISVGNGTLQLQLQHPCLPRGDGLKLPQLLVPKDIKAIPETEALVAGVMHWRVKERSLEPLLLEPQPGAVDGPKHLAPRMPLGQLGHGKRTLASGVSNGTRLCALLRQRQGHLFSRSFSLTRLSPGERGLVQIAVTGHGWAMTTAQCGEYCHAVYSLRVNGVSAANITQFREDCKLNPINGSVQMGTWDESRNGWCPGTVEPGLFLDVTKHLHEGKNRLDFEVSVWSNRTGAYEPYTDYGGFAFGDRANLVVGLSLLVYDAASVATANALPSARTAAEAALRSGSSRPAALQPARQLLQESGSLLALKRRRLFAWPQSHQRHAAAVDAAVVDAAAVALLQHEPAPATNAFNFEVRAPWYLYNTSAEGPLPATSLRIFQAALVQGNSRVVHANFSVAQLPAVWGQMALHLRLSKPPGALEFDHWDRVGSVGLVVDGHRVVGTV